MVKPHFFVDETGLNDYTMTSKVIIKIKINKKASKFREIVID
jgi:hypothetical protein